MKKILQLCLFLFCCTLFGQDDGRYCTEAFSSVNVTSDIQYATNIQVLTGAGLPVDLFMDVYEPEGDESTARPLVIMTHTGTFLPPKINGGVTGTRTDSALVEIAHRLAKRGFVVASIDYRLGWNPISSDRDTRVNTLINAAYRGIQDFKTAVRFLKMNKDVYNIDPDKIASFGLGTGGYLSYGVATLDKLEETQIEKFLYVDPDDGLTKPMIVPEVSGGIDGLPYPDNTSTNFLNIPNHPGYTSDVQFCFAAGGALADTSWVDENSLPMAAAHVVDDPFAPFLAKVLTEPVNNEAIVEVFGAGWAIPFFNNSGSNAILNSAAYEDDYSIVAVNKIIDLVAENSTGYGQLKDQGNIYPLQYKYPVSGPWEYFDCGFWSNVTCPDAANELIPDCNMCKLTILGNPDISKELGLLYIDTLVNYFVPRARLALNLEDTTCDVVGLDELSTINASVYPNPSASNFNINVPEEIIQTIKVYDMRGSLVKEITDVNANQYSLKGEDLNSGVYILNIYTKNNSVGQKIIVE